MSRGLESAPAGPCFREAQAERGPFAFIPGDHARQVTSRYYLQEAMAAADPPGLVLDLGCGDGSSAGIFRALLPAVRWVGVDLPGSDSARAIRGEPVVVYDGVSLPFGDSSVPLVYTNQVFEHVEQPHTLLCEIGRVLVPGGLLIGSTSQMEPYHAFSVWGGYTLHGWDVLCAEAGLVLEEVRPSIDAIALITRQYEGAQVENASWWTASPLNVEIDRWAEREHKTVVETNARKLQFCGQFAFRVRKPNVGARPVPPSATAPRGSLLRRVGRRLVGAGRR
jgi:SAM-dependent methyltransferase